uniref:Uncharacterized protein n=1 Tax=uncultured marine virus TaxID=186617 RepID=A0A0F7L4M8_9VIRU|nr:hypothetical protein [uncultured marine virus]
MKLIIEEIEEMQKRVDNIIDENCDKETFDYEIMELRDSLNWLQSKFNELVTTNEPIR